MASIPFHASLEPYNHPPSTFLLARPQVRRILCSNILFHPSSSSPLLTLIIRRAPTDYFPLLWETPGGSLDQDSDPSILSAACRELYEETGLIATKALRCIAVLPEALQVHEDVKEGYKLEDDGKVLTFPEPGTDWVWAKLTFFVEIEGGKDVNVVLQPEEHVDYRWITEEEVRQGQFASKDGAAGEKITFVSESVKLAILEAFRIKKEMMAPGHTPSVDDGA